MAIDRIKERLVVTRHFYQVHRQLGGWIVGGVGPRFEKEGVMDHQLFIESPHFNEMMGRVIFGDKVYNEHKHKKETWNGKTVYVDLLRLRYRMIYRAYLAYAIYGIMSKKGYISITDLGAGVWAIDNAMQSLMITGVIKDILDEFEEIHVFVLRDKIDTIDFTILGEGSTAPFNANKERKQPPHVIAEFIYRGINILFSGNSPSSNKGVDRLAFELYAWDGNSLPGNELWLTSASNNPQKIYDPNEEWLLYHQI